MKEIIRIHIAKIPYDIEHDAKRDIERYFKELGSYARDEELMRDIEIRISEILGERGVNANGVITADDIAAIKSQLGKPSDFKSDEDEAIVDDRKATSNFEKRKLYRDTDNAILGGVLSGLANYFGIDTIVARLIFVLLFVFSGGSFIMLYILFWIIMPPAKTASEKIRMTGRQVNLESIREYNESEVDLESKKQRASVIRNVIAAFFGSIFMLCSIAISFATMISGWLLAQYSSQSVLSGFSNWSVALILGLMVLAGLLLALLFAIFAYASFFQKFTKKIGTATIITIALGMLAFTSAVGIGIVQANRNGLDTHREPFSVQMLEDSIKSDLADDGFDVEFNR